MFMGQQWYEADAESVEEHRYASIIFVEIQQDEIRIRQEAGAIGMLTFFFNL